MPSHIYRTVISKITAASVIFLLFMTVSVSHAQRVNYNAYEGAIISPGDSVEWKNIDLPVIVNLNKGVIIVYAKDTQRYELISAKFDKDKEGNQVITYTTPDLNGKPFNVIMKHYDTTGPHVADFIVDFRAFEVWYRLRKYPK